MFPLQKLHLATQICNFPKHEICSIDTLIYWNLLIPVEISKKTVLYESIHSLKYNMIGKFALHSY